MAKGDIERRDAWTSEAPTLGVGAISAPQPRGGLEADAPKSTDPDFFIGSFTLQIVAPDLDVDPTDTPDGKGDIGDVYGAPDLSASDPHISGLVAWELGGPPLIFEVFDEPTTKGPITNPWSWEAGGPALGVGTIAPTTPKGDVGDMYGLGEGPIGQVVWETGTPTLGVGEYSTPLGQSDITNPYAWQDAVFYYTSQLYPLTHDDSFGEVLTLVDGHLGLGLIEYAESFAETMTLTAGFLNVVATYGFYTILPDSFGETLDITGGDLLVVVGFLSYTIPPESFSQTLTIVNGTLDVVAGYISYDDYPPESFGEVLTLVGGSLT